MSEVPYIFANHAGTQRGNAFIADTHNEQISFYNDSDDVTSLMRRFIIGYSDLGNLISCLEQCVNDNVTYSYPLRINYEYRLDTSHISYHCSNSISIDDYGNGIHKICFENKNSYTHFANIPRLIVILKFIARINGIPWK